MKLNISNIISKYVKLKRVGPGYTGACPFCGTDGTTDFIVSIQLQKYTCYKCGATGGIFQFLLSFKGFSIEQALNEVKQTFNIPFDEHFLDSRWNEYLLGTDYQKVLSDEAKKLGTFLEPVELNGLVSNEGNRVTYTELATFIRCPLEYKLRYCDEPKTFEPLGTRVNLGRFLHSVATQFLKLPAQHRNKEFIETMFREETSKKRNPEYINELQRFQDPTILLLTQYFIDKTVSDQSSHFTTTFGPFIITGTADCLINSNDGIQIVEFKEYDYREFDENVDVLRYLQLLFYYFGLEERSTPIHRGVYCFFNSGYTDEIFFSHKIIRQARDFILLKLQQIAECQDFSPKSNPLCVSCGYRGKCKVQVHAKGRT
jgi:CRISPR/Cas system-associated exonuclease Cas4 (RecB family)